MFAKILIANRGEIACRILRTARRMGIAGVAVYSEADRDAPHVAMADEAVEIGPAPASRSYLDIDGIVAAAQRLGADAVHPGYGFLAENARFARALADAGIAFIGPSPAAIAAMGDKIESKRLAAAAGVNIVPGHAGAVHDVAEAAEIAQGLGFPVMIKASAGGGGKGMRVVHSAAGIEESFASARSEAKSSFGDERMSIEKFVERPRHIEIQILADTHGGVIHLGERECSVQRRHQKVIEEAPSPFLDAETRAAMGAQAVALAKAVGYTSAGTVEFIVDSRRNFYFLEMNARLQVEHPVTELVTGLDLVEQMIRIAAGERLGLEQSDVTLNGWAVETRIYAEDPLRGFLPSIGRLARFRPPREESRDGRTVRVDTGVVEGGEISLHYDPMIAKLITHAPTRTEAIDAMSDALDAFAVDGIRHNVTFLAAVMQHPRWRNGELSTDFIAEAFPDGFRPRTPDTQERTVLAAVAATIDCMSNARRSRISQQMPGAPVRFTTARIVVLGADAIPVEAAGELGGPIEVAFTPSKGRKGKKVRVETTWWFGDPVWQGTVNGAPTTMQVRPLLNGVELAYRGVQVAVRVFTPREAALAALMPAHVAADEDKALRCPMPGLVLAVHVAEGQEVKAGEPLAVVEAMKMENVLRAERDGTVARILAQPGDSLAVDAVIMEFR